MKTKKLIINSFLLCCLGLSAKAQVLTLDSVLARVALNPSVRAYDAQIDAQNAYAAGAKSLDAPRLSAGQYQTPYSLNPNMGSFMIQGEQMFTNPAKLRAKENYQKSLSKVTAEERNELKNQLFAQARQYYYERVVLEKKLSLLQNTKALLEYMLKDANIRLTYGKEKLSNIYKAKAQLFDLDNIAEQLDAEISQKDIQLNTLMNRDKAIPFTIDTSLTIKDYEMASTDTAELAGARSDIKGIDRSIEVQQLNARMEDSKRKPDFGLQAGHMFSYGGYPNQYILMASVTIPIAPWASKEYKANLKGIRYEVEELRQKRLDMLNQAAGQLVMIKTELSSEKKQYSNYRENIIPALQNSYKTALQAYEQNTGDLPSVLSSINDMQTARMAALDRLQDILNLQVAYEKEIEKY